MFSKVGQRPQHARRSRRKVVRYVARLLLVVLFVASFVLSLLPWGRAFARASLLLPALVSGTESALLVNGGEEVRHRQMTVSSQSGPVFLDIYEPVASPPLMASARSGVLVIPGVGDNRQFPPLVNLLQALARTGLVVMNITTPTLINYDLSAQDSDAVVQAFQALAHQPAMHRIGLIAFSGGAILASLGAADARIRDRLAYVAISGGYFNTRSVLRAFGRRAIDIDGHTERWQPIDVPLLVMTNIITKFFASAEQERLKQALAPGGQPLTPLEQAQLSPGARAAYQLLAGSAPESVEENLAALPYDVQAHLDDLSPSRVVKQIRAPLFLLHDRNDASLPCTEARAFAAALAQRHHPYRYVEFHIFEHVQMRTNPSINQLFVDGWQLLSILTEMLATTS